VARKPTLRLAQGGAARPAAARGARPSKRGAVRARGSASASKKSGPRHLVRLRTGGVVHTAMKRAMRRAALRDCGQRCVYCATHLDQRTATLDHVFPLARGGAHDPGNLVVACGPCNRLKGDLPPFEFFARHPWAGANFVRYARSVHRALKRGARRAVSLAFARDDAAAA
jgi:5-methylcytosine-specific restriction endonuclease McrA